MQSDARSFSPAWAYTGKTEKRPLREIRFIRIRHTETIDYRIDSISVINDETIRTRMKIRRRESNNNRHTSIMPRSHLKEHRDFSIFLYAEKTWKMYILVYAFLLKLFNYVMDFPSETEKINL